MAHILAADARDDCNSIRKTATGEASLEWIVPKRARPYERALFHLPNIGLAAEGTIATEPRAIEGRYWAQVHKLTMLRYPASLTFLRKHHPSWKWPIYPRSYTSIDGEIEFQLEKLLKSKLLKDWVGKIVEGARKNVKLTRVERNRKARERCIEHYGSDCFGCGVSFSEKYGELATGFIHVHHLNPISGMDAEQIIDPIKDLRPICPNCHAVVHLQTPPLDLLELRKLLR